MPADAVGTFVDRDLVALAQQPSGRKPGDSGAYDRNP